MDTFLNIFENLLIKEIIFSFFATVFFANIMGATKKTIYWTGIIASIGYVICMIMVRHGNELAGYFIGTCIIVILSTMFSRVQNKPSITYIFPAVIPLVPGIGLYRTVLSIVQNNNEMAAKYGIESLMIAITMAMAMTVINVTSLLDKKDNK